MKSNSRSLAIAFGPLFKCGKRFLTLSRRNSHKLLSVFGINLCTLNRQQQWQKAIKQCNELKRPFFSSSALDSFRPLLFDLTCFRWHIFWKIQLFAPIEKSTPSALKSWLKYSQDGNLCSFFSLHCVLCICWCVVDFGCRNASIFHINKNRMANCSKHLSYNINNSCCFVQSDRQNQVIVIQIIYFVESFTHKPSHSMQNPQFQKRRSENKKKGKGHTVNRTGERATTFRYWSVACKRRHDFQRFWRFCQVISSVSKNFTFHLIRKLFIWFI